MQARRDELIARARVSQNGALLPSALRARYYLLVQAAGDNRRALRWVRRRIAREIDRLWGAA